MRSEDPKNARLFFWTKGATRRRLALFQPRARLDPGYPRSKWPLLLSPRWPSKAAAPASSPRCSSAPSGLISSTTCTPPWRYVQRAAISSDDDPRGRRGVPSPPSPHAARASRAGVRRASRLHTRSSPRRRRAPRPDPVADPPPVLPARPIIPSKTLKNRKTTAKRTPSSTRPVTRPPPSPGVPAAPCRAFPASPVAVPTARARVRSVTCAAAAACSRPPRRGAAGTAA